MTKFVLQITHTRISFNNIIVTQRYESPEELLAGLRNITGLVERIVQQQQEERDQVKS